MFFGFNRKISLCGYLFLWGQLCCLRKSRKDVDLLLELERATAYIQDSVLVVTRIQLIRIGFHASKLFLL
jgi:hypothetical protein